MMPPGLPTTRGNARARLLELAGRYESLMQEHGHAEWARYAGKLAEGPGAQAAMRRLRADEADVFEEARRILDYFGRGVLSPRHVQLWRHGALGLELLGDARSTELADQLEAIINSHEFKLDGKKISRGDLDTMRRSPDPAVRRATRTLEHDLHVRAAPVARQLLARRRDLAKEKHLRGFYPALLELRGVDPGDMDRLFRELLGATRVPYARLVSRLRRAVRRGVAPWDVDFALELVAGVPDVHFPAARALPQAFALYRAFGVDLERPHLDVTVRDFAFGGQTISVHVPDDVRVVVSPSPGAHFYATLVHELGHAYAATRTTTDEPLYKGYEWVPGLSDAAFAEGMAETFARLFDMPEVVQEHFGLDAATAQRLARQRRWKSLVQIRRGLAWIAFERVALENPDVDLDHLSLEVERSVGGIPIPSGTEPVWASSPFLSTYPVYTQSYVLAAMFAVQMREALRERFRGDWISPRAGAFITDRAVADGARWTLREKLVRATGAPLSAEPLVRYLSAD